MGQFFTKNEDPWHQILNDLEVTNSVDNFLRSISNKAKETKKELLLLLMRLMKVKVKGYGKLFSKLYQPYKEVF